MGIVSILLMITNLHVKFSSINSLVIVSLSVTAIISLWIFVYIERRAKSPLVDFKLVTNKVLFFANVLKVLFMFAILNAIPILIRNPKPIGFDEGAINTASIIIPFMAAYLTIGPIISKLGNTRVTEIGSPCSYISKDPTRCHSNVCTFSSWNINYPFNARICNHVVLMESLYRVVLPDM